MSTSSIASSLSLQDLYQPQSYHTDPHIRRDSPLLGFDNYSDDPLHFPAPGFPRDLCDSKRENAPLPLPPAVIPALHTRASALSLRKRASALSLRRIPTSSSIYPDSVRNAVYIDVDDVGERLGALLHASTLSRTSSFDSTLELDEDEGPDEDAAYFSSLYENPAGPSSQVYLGSPYAPSSPFSPPSPLDVCLPYHSAYTSTTTSPTFTPITPLSPPALLAPPPHVGSRWSLTSSLEAPPNTPDHPPAKKEKEKGKKGLAKQASSRDLKEREKAEKAPKRKRLTSFISRLSLGAGGLLSPTTTSSAGSSATSLPAQEREMREAYLERDDPPMIIRSLASPSTHDTTPDALYQSQPECDRDPHRPTHASANSWSSLIQGLGLGLVDDDPAPPIPAKDRTQHVPRSPRTKPALSIFTRLAAPVSASQILHSPASDCGVECEREFGEVLDRGTTPAGVTPTPPTPTPASPSYYSSSYGDAESRSASPSSRMAFTCAPPSPTASVLDSDMGHGSRRERELERRRKEGERVKSTVQLEMLLPSPELSAPSPSPVPSSLMNGKSVKAKKEKKPKKSKANLSLNTNTINTNTDSDSILSLGLGVLSTAPTSPCFSPTSPTSPSYAFPASSIPSAPASPERAVRSRRSTGLGGFRGLARRMRLGSTPTLAPAVPKKDPHTQGFVVPSGYGEYPPLPLSPRGEGVYTPDGECVYPQEVERKTRLVYPYPYVDPGVGIGRPGRRGYGHARRRESVVL